MRKMVSLLALFVLCTAGCSSSSAPEKTDSAADTSQRERVIGVSLLTMNNPFFVEMAEAMTDEARKHGFRLDVVSGDYKVATQKGQIEDFLVKGVDAIILCPCDSKSIGPPIQHANAKGVPVFTADIACLAKDAKVVCHVATDNKGGGRLAAQAVAEMLGGNGKIGILEYPEIESCLLRTDGFHEEIKKWPGIEVAATLSGGADRKPSYDATNDMLQAHPEISGIFAINDPSALGCIAKLKEKGMLGKIKVVGFDAHPEGCKAVEAGDLYATITQDQRKIGRTVVSKVAQYLGGEEVEKEILIPCTIYRKGSAAK